MVKEKYKIFFPNLDGLRFLCFLSVFLFHSFYTEYSYIKDSTVYVFVIKNLFVNGNLGVNFFFVLSGFLITFLLIKEKELQGKINILNFWMRRILRIWPLYFFCVFFGFIIFPTIKQLFGQTPNESANPIYYLFFINNFDFINKGVPDASILGVLWSIAIEEQFYLVWPILLAVIPNKYYPALFLSVITGSCIFRAVYDTSIMHEHHTLSCMGDMAIGALGAYGMNQIKYRIKMENMSKKYILLIYLFFVSILLFRQQFLYTNYYTRIFERSFIAIVILFIIMEQNFSKKSLFKLANFKLISNLGVISYGLYCLHFIGILITVTITKKLNINNSLWEILIIETIVSLCLTICISWISFNFFEKYFLNLKDKFSIVSK
ncbi:MAG TPA: acyltransferase [Bacteroidia bacterium]|jgi:peptidoglycan/LPS O-acetylase OafA/YrhL|nr:acyltransferase [Bacteroidia bacterium]